MKKNRLNSNGFVAFEVFLGLLLLSLVAFAVWRVFWPKTNVTPSAEPKWEIVDSAKASKKDGFIDYENKTMGFKMTYPKTWGSVEATKGLGKEPQFEQGVGYVLNFTDYDRVTISAVTKNWQYTGAEIDPSCRAVGFTEYQQAKLIEPTEKYYGRMLIDKPDLWVAESISTDISKAVKIEAKKAYKNNQTFAGLSLAYCDESFNVALSDESSIQLVDKYKNSPTDFISKINREEVLAVINSISEF